MGSWRPGLVTLQVMQVVVLGGTIVFLALAVASRTTQIGDRIGLGVVTVALGGILGAFFLGSVVSLGFPFFNVTTPANLWVVLFALIGYAVWDGAFLFCVGYVQQIVVDILISRGVTFLPGSPFVALANLGVLPATAVLLVLAFAPMAIAWRRFLLALRQPWGQRYLVLFVLMGLALTPLYGDGKVHVAKLITACWIVLFVPSLVLTLGVRRVERLTKWLLLLTLAVLVSAMAATVFSTPLSEFIQGGSSAVIASTGFRAGGSLYGANNLSLSVLALSPFLLAFLRERKGAAWSEGIAILSIALLMYRGDTRTAWLGFLPVLTLFYGVLREWKQLFFIAIVAAVALLVFPYLVAHMLNAVPGRGSPGATNNLIERFRIWNFALGAAWTSPTAVLVGVGWAAEPARWPSTLAGNWDTLHSLWVADLVRTGLLGTVLWLGFLLEPFVKGLRYAKRVQASRRPALAAGLAAIVGLLFFSLTANLDWPQATQMAVLIVLNVWAVAQNSTAQLDPLTEEASKRWR
jgi:O-antigen ligase